jgi:uncharacterized surface protein with fasciclin (FAS1) repeats
LLWFVRYLRCRLIFKADVATGAYSVTNEDGVITATITTADVQASNGILHIVDAVLVPDSAHEVRDLVQPY